MREMSWWDWSIYWFAILAEASLYLWGLGAMLYGIYYFGRLAFKKIFSSENKEN